MQPNPQEPFPAPPGPRRQGRVATRPRSHLVLVRALIGALALTLGIVLIVQGNVLVGTLIAVLAVLRVVAMAAMHRRRTQWRAAAEARRSEGPWPRRA